MMHLTAALLTLALAGPVDSGPAAAPMGSAAVALDLGAVSVDHGGPASSRARAPLTPPLRRLLRKRDVIAPVTVGGGGVVYDRSLALLALDLDRSSTCLLGRARALTAGDSVPLRFLLAGLQAHAVRIPPPSLPR